MKFKKISYLLLAFVMLFSLAACSKDNTSEPVTEDAKETESTLEEKVVIYSTHSEDMLVMLADAFEEETGVKVEFINLKGELADRVRAEKDNPQADIMFGGASSIFMELKEEGLYEQYETTWAKDLDSLYKDSENYWYGTIQTPVMMFYNSEILSSEEAPKDWSDLTNESFKDQLVFRNALSSSRMPGATSAFPAASGKAHLIPSLLRISAWPFLYISAGLPSLLTRRVLYVPSGLFPGTLRNPSPYAGRSVLDSPVRRRASPWHTSARARPYREAPV